MFQTDLVTLLLIIAALTISLYKISFLSKKNIGYFSILQFIYLVILPGIIYILLFGYTQSILDRPLNHNIFIPDKLIINLLLLSELFTYGGLAIHAVTKMLSDYLRTDDSEVAKLNRYFHLTFSHNLVYGGACAIIVLLTLLEINHQSNGNEYNLFRAVITGVMFAACLITGMYWYTRSNDDYFGKWSDLKSVLLIGVVGLFLVFSAIRKVRPDLNEYQTLIPTLVSFSIISGLNLLFIFRRLKRGGFRIYFRSGKQEQKVFEINQSIIPPHNKQSPTK